MTSFVPLFLAQADDAAPEPEGTDAVRRVTADQLSELVRQESLFVGSAIQREDEGIVVPQASAQQILERPMLPDLGLGAGPEQWFAKMIGGPVADHVRGWVQTGIQRGLTTDEIVRGLSGTRNEPGILEDDRNHVGTLVRSAAAHASSQTRMDAFEAIGVDQWQFVATLDLRTSTVCKSNDGKVFDVGQGPLPPLHPNCRSTAVPWFGEELSGTRASSGGQVSSSTHYQQWLKQQSKEDQDQALGKRRAAAWRSGKLSFEQMVGRDLEPLTLAELERLDRI